MRRHLRFRDRDGGCELVEWLDCEAPEIVRAALSPLAAPHPATDSEIDLRTTSQRDADALVDLAQRALQAGDLPTEGGERPQVVVTVSLAVVLGARGEPLDVGRARYTAPTAIRRAVIVRDGGCALPGCSVPARWCEIHHVLHWADNGPTSVENCVALCGRHHKLLYHSRWRIDMASGTPELPTTLARGPPRRNPSTPSPT